MLNAADLVEKKYQSLPHISTYNMVTKSGTLDDKSKPNIYDGQYFEILVKEGDTLVVRYIGWVLWVPLFFSKRTPFAIWVINRLCECFRCNICGPDGPQLRASTKSSGNILKHIQVGFSSTLFDFEENDFNFLFLLQRRHYALMETIKMEKNIKSRTPRFEKQRPNKKMKVEIKTVGKCQSGFDERRV